MVAKLFTVWVGPGGTELFVKRLAVQSQRVVTNRVVVVSRQKIAYFAWYGLEAI